MRRADRLFQIVQYLRGGRLVTARKLSTALEVSERTIYRDIADLQTNGVPIDGEAGVGYIMRDGYDLPPLMFTRDEIVALVAGARMVRAWGGADMARAAEEALVKISAVLPDSEARRVENTQIHAPSMNMTERERTLIDELNKAAETLQTISIEYRDEGGVATSRDVRPLGLWFWGKVWTLVSWCEMREDFRMFRIDRIAAMKNAGRPFRAETGKRLVDFYRRMEHERPNRQCI